MMFDPEKQLWDAFDSQLREYLIIHTPYAKETLVVFDSKYIQVLLPVNLSGYQFGDCWNNPLLPGGYPRPFYQIDVEPYLNLYVKISNIFASNTSQKELLTKISIAASETYRRCHKRLWLRSPQQTFRYQPCTALDKTP